MNYILGINSAHANSSVALIADGEPIFAIAEERLQRKKYYAGFPVMGIQACFDFANISWKDIKYVAIGRDPKANKAEKIKYTLKNPSKIPNLLKIKNNRTQLDDLKTTVLKNFPNISEQDLTFEQVNIEHHLAHIASAYYPSGWNEAAGISMDGSGDFVSVMMAECKGHNIDIKKKIFLPHSLGTLYTMVCEFVGYDRYGDEGKVMGLAPLGTDKYHSLFDDFVILEKDGFKLNKKYFMPLGSTAGVSINEDGEVALSRHYSDKMIEIFGEPRKRHADITQRDMDMSFSLQYTFERVYMHLLQILEQLVPNENVAIAGGCALNSVANGKLFDFTNFKNTFIQPASGDDGLALGAALYVSQNILKDKKTPKMVNSYLGNEYSNEEIEQCLIELNVPFQKLNDEQLVDTISDHIVNGEVIGWFQGRMEWGPRALGSRSIVAHPGYPNMKDILNARIKHREPFRPFAPAVLEEYQSDIFEKDHPSPFMLHVYKIKENWRKKLAAVNHLDNTGRLQTVNPTENKLYYELIKKFNDKTGIPVIINTSFNENEPIVHTPKQAIDCYLRTKMDVLAIGNYYSSKKMKS